MYRILEDEEGQYWVAKITATRVVLQKGTLDNLARVPNCNDVGYLKDFREGRTVLEDTHKPPQFL